MTLEELKKEYKNKFERCHKEAIEAKEMAKRYERFRDLYDVKTLGYKNYSDAVMNMYQKAITLLDQAVIYFNIVRDLNNLEIK